MKRNPKPATAGEKIAASVWFCKIMNGKVPPTLDDQETLMRRIDAAIRRAVRKERERCEQWALYYLGRDCDAVVGIREGKEP